MDNHNGVVTTYSQTSGVCGEVKWTLGSITTNKASGDDGIPAEIFLKSCPLIFLWNPDTVFKGQNNNRNAVE